MSVYSSTAVDIVQKNSIHISNSKTLYVGGSGPGNYTKIQEAINDASDGDTVFVYDDSSPYFENIVVHKSINLIGEIIDLVGENSYTTVIDGNNSGDVVFVTANWVNISVFTIQNGNEFGMKIHSSNNTIKNNIIINNQFGVYFSYKDHYNNRVLNNTIKFNSLSGIVSQSSKNLTIVGNEITDHEGAGIYFHKCQFSNISHNIISNNDNEGINMQWHSNNSLISNNIITKNGFFGFWLVCSYRCIVRNNYFEKNGWELSIIEEEDSIPSNHSIYHNIIVDGSNNECYDTGTSFWDNGYPSGGNYWNSYDGIDFFSGPNQDILGSDGIGDTPYPIPFGHNEDRYPLMEPYGMTELSFDFITGLFSFSGIIKNIGEKTALNVQSRTKVEGGFVLNGKNTHEIVPEPLLPGEETMISPVKILGFGRITLTIEVWADNAPMISVSKPAFLFLFFVLIK